MRPFRFNKSQKTYLVIKRVVDIIGSLFGLLLLSPIIILTAIITKLTSRGPVIYKSKRIGRYGKTFTFYKFRSMKINAPQIGRADVGEVEHETYVTKWGKVMRKTSLDELPQLFNILKGDMSFIGPRPALEKEKEMHMHQFRMSYLPDGYQVRPGLSGYSQITLHRDHSPERKSRGDSYYIRHLSMWLDIKLFLMSFLVLFGWGHNQGD